MPVDDNGFMLLKTATKQVAFLHASCTEWKNVFSWELYGRDGKLQVEGLGGSYGVESLSWYKNLPEMGPPETMIWEYPMADNSWTTEMTEFIEDIRSGREPAAGLQDAIAALDSRSKNLHGTPDMIIARSPLRITFGGGGTDLASYYGEHEGFLVAAAIDKYVYVTVTRPFSPGIYLKYSALEHVERVADVKHPIIREALELQNLDTPQIEITTLADIPAGTGLGSSGQLHHGAVEGAFYAPPQGRSCTGAGRTRLRY